MSLRFTSLGCYFSLLLGAALSLGSCRSADNEGSIDPQPAAPTPYTLAVPAGFPTPVIPVDNPLTNEGVALGRMLFYETKLSSTNTLSCGSCHQQSKAFTDGLAKAVGVNGQVNPRGTMSLANVAWSKTLTWDGAFSTLETQALKPIENNIELHQPLTVGVSKLQASSTYPPLFLAAFGTRTITNELVLKALSQFERTLVSSNSRFDKYLANQRPLSTDEAAGFELYKTHIISTKRGAECFHCHTMPLASSNFAAQFFNNGLDVRFSDPGRGGVTNLPADQGKFVAPTLRNITLTAPYMHDGRFTTLEQVLDHYSDHVQMASPGLDGNLLNVSNTPFGTRMDLTATEKRQIITFLKTLTDSTFITDKRFSDPFKP